jgi:quinolinate synthase
LKFDHPEAKLIAHPECKAVILQMADFIGSTTALLNYTQKDTAKEFIVATETGILHQMQKISPDKKFYIVPADETCACNDCPYMKLNTLPKLLNCLKNESPEIILSDDLMDKARKPILRMLELSK